MTDATNTAPETTTNADADADAAPVLVFPTTPAVDADATATVQWTRADDAKDRKNPDAGLRYTDGLDGCRGHFAVVGVTTTDADGNDTTENVVVALDTHRAVARVKTAHAAGHSVTFARLAGKTEFAPPAAPKTKKTVVVSLSDGDRAALTAAYAVADDAGKTALAAGFPWLADATA